MRRQSHRKLRLGPVQKSLTHLAGSFDRWWRCSLDTDRCGYAPPSRLASDQNACAILRHEFLDDSLEHKRFDITRAEKCDASVDEKEIGPGAVPESA